MGEEAICDPHNKSESHVFLEKFNLNLFWFDISLYKFKKKSEEHPKFYSSSKQCVCWKGGQHGNQNNLVILTFLFLCA